jgi:O-antigen/teichoic acid export membrane protein
VGRDQALSPNTEPSGTGTDALGRARTARLVRGIGSSVVARAATSVAPLVLIPLTLDYLGAARYGLWMAVTSITSMFLWADLGLGNGLLTRLSPMVTRQEWVAAREVTSSAYKILATVGLLGGCLAIASFWLVPWETALNAREGDQASGIATVCLVAFAVNIPLALVHRVLFALQRVSLSNGVYLFGAALSVALATLAVAISAPQIVVITLVVLSPLIANAVGSVLVFRSFPALRPRLRSGWRQGGELMFSGLRFLGVGVLTAIALNVDYLIVAHVSSVERVATFSVVARLFMALGLLVTVVNLPLWPANAEALTRGDHTWVRRTTTRMVVVSGGVVALAGGLMVAVSTPLLAILGLDRSASPLLMVGFAALWTSLAMVSPLFMVQNSVGLLGPQLLGWLVFAGISIPLKLLVGLKLGVEWIPVVGTLLYVVCVVPCAYFGYRRVFTLASAAPGHRSGFAADASVDPPSGH